MNVDDIVESLKSSKCFTCKHRFTKVMKPLTKDDFEFFEDTLNIDDLGDFDDYDIEIEIHRCIIEGEDITCQVLECNKYEPDHKSNLLRGDRF